MTTIPEALAALEAAPEPTWTLSDMVRDALGWTTGYHPGNPSLLWMSPAGKHFITARRPHVTADLQACIDHVVPEGWRVTHAYWDHERATLVLGSGPHRWFEGKSTTPALALCIASLKAEGQADG